jgi:hypothetical protein
LGLCHYHYFQNLRNLLNLQSTLQHECTLILFTINCRRYVACSSSSSELGGGPYIASGVLFYNTDPDLNSTESLLELFWNDSKTEEVNLGVFMVPKKLAYLKMVKSDRTLSVLVVLEDEKNPSYITAYDLRVVVPSAAIASCFELEGAGTMYPTSCSIFINWRHAIN